MIMTFLTVSMWGILMVSFLTGCPGGGSGGGDNSNPNNTPTSATVIGNPLDSAVTSTIGPAGGTLTSADGSVTLTVPAGAVSSPTEFSVQPVENKAHGGVGNAYRLGPDGVTLANPITLTFQVSGAGTAGAFLGIAYQDSQGCWQWINDVTLDAPPPGTTNVSVTIDHFTDLSLVSGVQLMPLQAAVSSKTIVQLKVVICLPEKLAGGAVTLMRVCGEAPPLVKTSNWSVNGTPGGNSTVGTIQAINNIMATYTAPDKAPNPNKVAVTVDIPPMKTGGQKIILFSEITINDGAWLLGTWSGTIPHHDGDPSANPFEGKALTLVVSAQQTDPEKNPGNIFYEGKVTFDGTTYQVTLPFNPVSNLNQIIWSYGDGSVGSTEDVVVFAGDGSQSFVNFWWGTPAVLSTRPTQLDCDWSIQVGGLYGTTDSNAGGFPKVILTKQ